jgi:hypothetical protein
VTAYHDGYVQKILADGGGWFAVCMSCGSRPFPDRRTEAEAAADVAAHAREFAGRGIRDVHERSLK